MLVHEKVAFGVDHKSGGKLPESKPSCNELLFDIENIVSEYLIKFE